jgi:hypothetical protein
MHVPNRCAEMPSFVSFCSRRSECRRWSTTRLVELLVHAVANRETQIDLNMFTMSFLRYAYRIYLCAMTSVLESAFRFLLYAYGTCRTPPTSDKTHLVWPSRFVLGDYSLAPAETRRSILRDALTREHVLKHCFHYSFIQWIRVVGPMFPSSNTARKPLDQRGNTRS